MIEEPLVSVCVLVYNHKKYLEKCLDSILGQKTLFPFEVILHDDASYDGSQEVILHYAQKYPKQIIPILQSENQYSKDRCIHRIYREFLYPKVRGKYIAYCEGDDFWYSGHKLQKEVEILEEHVDCHMCLHYVEVTNEQGVLCGWGYPQKKIASGVLSSYQMMKGLTDGYFFHTTSFMTRYTDIKRLIEAVPDYYLIADVDDVPLLLYMGQLGNSYYINERLSCYRRNSHGSWTESQTGNKEKIIAHKWRMIRMYKAYDRFTDGIYHDLVTHWIRNERFMIAEYEHDYVELSKPYYKRYMKNRSVSFIIRVKVGMIIQKLFYRRY